MWSELQAAWCVAAATTSYDNAVDLYKDSKENGAISLQQSETKYEVHVV